MLVQADGRLSHDAQREVQADIAADAERLYRLVEDLLVLTRSEHGSLEIAPEPVLLQRLLPRVVDSERSRWPTVTFRVDLPPGIPPVVGEETYVEQVVRNLLSNAGKYGGAQGRVTLTVAVVEDFVEIRVLDEGPGLGDEDPDSLFQLFYRADSAVRRASGAGIGLYACRELVTALGGRIWARSRPGGGAEFGFALRIFVDEL
jgi:signal transduction histidine kinase